MQSVSIKSTPNPEERALGQSVRQGPGTSVAAGEPYAARGLRKTRALYHLCRRRWKTPAWPHPSLQQLILKMLYSRGDMLGRELSEALGLKFSLIEGIIDFFKHQHFIEAKKSLGMGNSTVLFALTETGRNSRARMHGEQPVRGPGARSAASIHADRPEAAARRWLAHAGGSAAGLSAGWW